MTTDAAPRTTPTEAGGWPRPRTQAARAVDDADTIPLVARVRDHARDVLAPAALATDQGGVPRNAVDDLRRLGALNHLAPAAYGGAGLDRSADRRLHELISHADLNTWLVWAQHAPVVARIARARSERVADHPLAEATLRGDVLVGAALSDVRRFPQGHLAAVRRRDGWTVDGTISWFSGWGLSEAVLLAAVDASREAVVLALVPLDDQFVGRPLALSAVAGSRTHRVDVRSAHVRDEHVLAVQPLSEWRHGDVSTAGNAGAQFFGLGRRLLDELASEPGTEDVVGPWSDYLGDVRARAYELADAALDGDDPDARLEERIDLKARAGESVATLSRALLVVRAGRGLPADDTAQLHARSALFLQVQGQTRAVRATQLGRIAAGAPTLP